MEVQEIDHRAVHESTLVATRTVRTVACFQSPSSTVDFRPSRFVSIDGYTEQKLRLLEIPAALPILFGGLRIGATLSVIGAVVGEFVGSDKGLGFLINVGRGQFDTALVFVSIFSLIFMALSLYGLAMLAEKRSTRWKNAHH